MVKAIKQGDYRLIQTDNGARVLNLSQKKNYIWIRNDGNGEIKIVNSLDLKTSSILAEGKYRVYEVNSETKLADGLHLELSTGPGRWQGYLLTQGLPKHENLSSRIVPTIEVITKSTSL